MGEEEETVTANMHGTPPAGLSNTVNAQLGQTMPLNGGKEKLRVETSAKGENWKP